MAPRQVKWKQLAESLIIFKLGYNRIVCYPLPAYLQKKVQRVRNVDASFVRNRYSTEQDFRNLGWLTPLKRRKCTSSNFSPCDTYEYLARIFAALPLHDPKRNLRSSDTLQIAIPMEKHTFQNSAAKPFNSLPANLRWWSCNDVHRCHQLVTYVFEEREGLRLAEMSLVFTCK